jgi:hypothetical protein
MAEIMRARRIHPMDDTLSSIHSATTIRLIFTSCVLMVQIKFSLPMILSQIGELCGCSENSKPKKCQMVRTSFGRSVRRFFFFKITGDDFAVKSSCQKF